jgi:hypothetical protein
VSITPFESTGSAGDFVFHVSRDKSGAVAVSYGFSSLGRLQRVTTSASGEHEIATTDMDGNRVKES